MKLRTLLAGSVTLLIAVQGMAVIKTYTADGDNSTKFPTDRRIYRGDCDPDAATPNAGDDAGVATDDQCTCTPGVDCRIGSLGGECTSSEGRPNGGACDPAMTNKLCSGGVNAGMPCTTDAFCGAGNHCSGACDPSFPTHSSDEPPCNLTTGGTIVINDTGNNAPTLTSMQLIAEWDDFVGATTVAGIPGATVQLHAENTISVAPNQTGVGSTGGVINWGTISGWSQTGRLFCQTNCPGGCGAASGCKPFVGFDGLGPPAPLKPPQAYNTDPWNFTGDEFTSATSFEIVSLGLGAVTANLQMGGRLVAIPALPLAALGGLGAGLVYLGARALGRKRD
jgi:hypothetical protein